ncbi:MAG TPA: hypothetical protein P5572_11155 [Phycisphaerae bacterium]|nr:hypothetical protein [Phycisphaerae bacterium]
MFACMLAAAGVCVVGSGCVAGSLATQTGALPGETWSNAPRQMAHVGETVPLSFVLKKPLESKSINAVGLADYCVFDVNGERYDVDVSPNGAFETEITLTHAKPGSSIPIVATAFRENEGRDHMRIAGEWLTNESPRNTPDDRIASAAVTLEIYQSHVDLTVPPLPDGLDVGTARLVLHRRNGGDAIVFVNRPPRRGFTVAALPAGGWHITYDPAADEVNPTGTTRAEFSFYDRAGNRHEYRTELPTP